MKALKRGKKDLFCIRCKQIKGTLEIYFEIEYPSKIDREIMLSCSRCKDKILEKVEGMRECAIQTLSKADPRVFVGKVKIRRFTVINSNSQFY